MSVNRNNRFLRVVGGRYDVRRRIPAGLVPRFGGRREIIRSIGSLPFAEALERARRLTVATDRLFRMIARRPELTADQIGELIEDWFARRVASQDRWREQFRPAGQEAARREQRIAEARILRANAEAARIHAARMRGDLTARPAGTRCLTVRSPPGRLPP